MGLNKHSLRLFPQLVNIYQLEDSYEHIEHLIQDQMFNNIDIASHPNDIWQSISGQHKRSEYKQLNDHVLKIASDYAIDQSWDIDTNNLYIADCWWNASTGKSNTHFAHIHSNSLISVVFYLSAPTGSGDLVFPHPQLSYFMLNPSVKEWIDVNMLEYKITPRKGMCLVFKSSTPHLVDTNNTNDIRISIAYTLNIKKLGNNSHLASYEER